ncbi:MAG TPA: cytochrome c1 [Lysobacter sp.]|nr:cytochrome c1 [Lysobacter sp.]
MTKTSFLARRLGALALVCAGLFLAAPAFAAGAGNLQQAGTDLNDRASLQRGAKLYMNYCSGCHSLKYLRYSRMAEDLGLSEEQVMQNLNFTGAKFGEHINTALTPEQGTQWFGKNPPDLSLVSRVRGRDWVYTYLKSFYLDESRPVGWNNTLFANASMPNPLWKLQGLQVAEYGELDKTTGERPVTGLKLVQAGALDEAGFDQAVRDITAFLEYAGEPATLKRRDIGVWVILFLALFTFLAWLLKREYWRDVEH